MTEAVAVVGRTEQAQALLHPARLAILEALATPASAAALAERLRAPRQRLNYHLRELEEKGLVEVAEEARRGSVIERVYRRAGERYAISVEALGAVGSTPEAVQDRASSAYQIAVASRAVRDLALLRERAASARKSLPTFSLEVDVRFADAEARHAFSEDLARAVADLAQRYHDERPRGGRTFRFYLGAYPRVRR